MNFNKLYNTIIKEGFYSDDEEEEEIETIGIRGEYWFDESGSAIYADGDIGDMNHEAYVIQQCAGEVANEFGLSVECDDGLYNDSSLEEDILNTIIEELDIEDEDAKENAIDEIKNDPASAMINYLIKEGNHTKDQANDLVLTAYGSTRDAREYAIKNWGWSRVHGDSIETKVLTRDALKRIASGINDAIDQEGLLDGEDVTEEKLDQHEYTISTYTGKRYTIKLCDMEKGKVEDLEEEQVPEKTAATQQVRQMDLDSMPEYYKNKGIIGDSVNYL